MARMMNQRADRGEGLGEDRAMGRWGAQVRRPGAEID